MRWIGVALGAMVATAPPSTADGQAPGGGSTVPCAVPLRWRVARVDREFGLSAERATEIVAEAAGWWESVTPDVVFEHDPDRGFPIRLVFDERQAQLQERDERLRALQSEGRELEAARADLDTRREALLAREARYRDRARSYERRIDEHNEEVRRWNRTGGAPPEVARALEEREAALGAERLSLDDDASGLQADVEALQADEGGFNRRVTEHTRRGVELERAYPLSAVQAGEYREAVRSEDGRVVSVGREIRVYRFSDEADLRLVTAHELGHALGLAHSSNPLTVMAEQHVRVAGSAVPDAVAPEDAQRLGALCPALSGR